MKHLKEAEKEGKFVQLIPGEKINWDTPIIKCMINTHVLLLARDAHNYKLLVMHL